MVILHPMLRAFTANVKGLTSVSPDVVAVAFVGISALFGWFIGNFNSTLFTIVLFAMVMDLIVGAMRAVVDPLTEYQVSKLFGGLLGKLFRLLIIPTASLIDALYAFSPFPANELVQQTFPVTVATMYMLAAAEISSTLDHFRNGGVAPGAIAVVMRHLDRIKLGAEPPKRRSYDLAAKVEQEETDA